MLTISLPPELEDQLQTEAQRRGLSIEELAVQELRAFLQSDGVADDAEANKVSSD